jgi:gephyrin
MVLPASPKRWRKSFIRPSCETTNFFPFALGPRNMSHSNTNLRACILIVSDTASEDPSADRSGDILAGVLSEGGQWTICKRAIVPDNKESIQDAVQEGCSAGANLIITSGGTGFAQKDVTPEAVAPLLDKHAPGLV